MEIRPSLTRARQKLDNLIKAVERVICVHELNAHIQYSGEFIKKVNKSFASNGLITIQNELMASELLGVCKIWDRYDFDGYSLTTIVEFAKEQSVRSELREEIASGGCFHLKAADDFSRAHSLASLSQKVNLIRESEVYTRTVNHRNKHIAHLLETTQREKCGKIDANTRARYGDADFLLSEAKSCVTELFPLLVDGSLRLETYVENYKSQAKLFAESVQFLSTGEFNASKLKV